jgi:hypothetical protein
LARAFPAAFCDLSSGRPVRDDERGAIQQDQQPFLQRLYLEQDAWLRLTTEFEALFKTLVGIEAAIQSACAGRGVDRRRA